MMANPPAPFDRRISWAILFAIAVQTAGALLWTGAAAERIAAVEDRAAAVSDLSERIARLEEQISAAREQLDRLEHRFTPYRER